MLEWFKEGIDKDRELLTRWCHLHTALHFRKVHWILHSVSFTPYQIWECEVLRQVSNLSGRILIKIKSCDFIFTGQIMCTMQNSFTEWSILSSLKTWRLTCESVPNLPWIWLRVCLVLALRWTCWEFPRYVDFSTEGILCTAMSVSWKYSSPAFNRRNIMQG